MPQQGRRHSDERVYFEFKFVSINIEHINLLITYSVTPLIGHRYPPLPYINNLMSPARNTQPNLNLLTTYRVLSWQVSCNGIFKPDRFTD